jgi:tetratricopeptide (TPR) repeat protein
MLVGLAFMASCANEPAPPPELALGPPQTSDLEFQAVDAGTGGALTDRQLTVRYLVRSPITLDASAVERVSSTEPYRIEQEIAEDEMVIEVRLEADSYHRLDTVLSAPRGGSAGPFTLRMSRRLERAVSGRPARRPVSGSPTNASAGGGTPAASRPAAPPPSAGDASVDRSAMLAGDRAFRAGKWLAATEAYQRMPAPNDETSDYAGQYQAALLRRGVAHINRAEYGGALEALEEATDLPNADFRIYLRLGQAQCAVGRTEEGRGTLATLGRRASRLRGGDKGLATSLVEYQRGICSQGEFDRAKSTMDRVRTGARAIRELQAFIGLAEALPSAPDELQNAVDDAKKRIADMQSRIRG